jgi:hypothetical protein
MKRSDATRRLEGVLERLAAQGRYAQLVDSVWIFGGYAQGRSEVKDIDVAIGYTPNAEFRAEKMQAFWRHRSPYVDFRRELFGSQRVFHLHWEGIEELQRELGNFVAIYRRGDTLDRSLARLHGIIERPDAPRAARDRVIAELADLEGWLPRPDRNEITSLVHRGLLCVERIELAEAVPTDPETRFEIEFRWNERNPRRRAAYAAAAYLEVLGITSLYQETGEASLVSEDGSVAVSLGSAETLQVVHFLESGGNLWLEVGPIGRSKPLVGLLLRPVRSDRAAGEHEATAGSARSARSDTNPDL